MSTPSPSSTYIDCFQYQQQPTGFAITNYISNQFRFAAGQTIGTRLTVPASAIQTPLSPYSFLYIFDELNSEIVQVATETAPGSTSITLVSATQYTHNAGVAVCGDGSSGSLGQQIFSASRWIEDICHQSLWESPYTGEILTLPTMRAAYDNQWNLHFRPRHFPIATLTAISIQTSQNYITTLNANQAIIDSDQQTVDLPYSNTISSNVSQIGQFSGYPFIGWGNRTSNAWITLAYTAGFSSGQLPWTIQRACTLLTSEMFVQNSNPVGADQINQGKRSAIFAIRGDTSGDTLLVKQAFKLLTPYIAESF